MNPFHEELLVQLLPFPPLLLILPLRIQFVLRPPLQIVRNLRARARTMRARRRTVLLLLRLWRRLLGPQLHGGVHDRQHRLLLRSVLHSHCDLGDMLRWHLQAGRGATLSAGRLRSMVRRVAAAALIASCRRSSEISTVMEACASRAAAGNQ